MVQASMFPRMGIKELSIVGPLASVHTLPPLTLLTSSFEVGWWRYEPKLQLSFSTTPKQQPSFPKLSCVDLFSHGSSQEHRTPAWQQKVQGSMEGPELPRLGHDSYTLNTRNPMTKPICQNSVYEFFLYFYSLKGRDLESFLSSYVQSLSNHFKQDQMQLFSI